MLARSILVVWLCSQASCYAALFLAPAFGRKQPRECCIFCAHGEKPCGDRCVPIDLECSENRGCACSE